MRIFCHLSFVAFLLALALQFLVVRDAEKGAIAGMDDIQRDRAEQRAAAGSDETVKAREPRKAFLGEAVNYKADVPQLALGALILAVVLWAVAILRKEDRPYYGTNAVLLVVFCIVRWLNFL